jgi:hypothetical protein
MTLSKMVFLSFIAIVPHFDIYTLQLVLQLLRVDFVSAVN